MRIQFRHVVMAIFLTAMLGAALAGILAPYRNWDMLCYVASVDAWTLDTPDAIYNATMSTVTATSPDWLPPQFVANPLSANAASFVHVLPMCQVKPLYNLSIWAISGLTGVALPTATWTVSALAFAALSVLLAMFPLKECPRSAWLTAVLILTFVGQLPMASLPHMSTPDALCILFMMAATLGLLTRRERVFSVAAVLASLARPDAAIPMACLAAWSLRDCWKSPRGRTWMIPAAGLALIVIGQMAVGRFAHSYSYDKMYYYTFVNRTPAIASLSDNLVSIDTFLSVLSSGFNTMLGSARFWAIAGAALLGGAAYYLIPAPSIRRPARILGILWAAFAIRFAIWPASGEDRFYFGYFLISLCCSLELLAPCFKVAHAALLGARGRLIETHRSLGESPRKPHI